MTTSLSVTYRHTRSVHIFMLLLLALLVFLGLPAALRLGRESPWATDHWGIIVIVCIGTVHQLVLTLDTWRVRYEFSGTGLIRRGLLSEKTVYWDRLQSIHIAQDNEIRLEGRDGTVLTVYAQSLQNGQRLIPLLHEAAGAVPVQEMQGTAGTYDCIRHLPYFTMAGGVASLGLATVGQQPGMVWAGFGIGLVYVLGKVSLHYLADREREVVGYSLLSSMTQGAWPWVLIFGLSLSWLDRGGSPMLLQLTSLVAGAVFSVSLMLLPFQARILTYLGRGVERKGV